jgi:hypothetical protein
MPMAEKKRRHREGEQELVGEAAGGEGAGDLGLEVWTS